MNQQEKLAAVKLEEQVKGLNLVIQNLVKQVSSLQMRNESLGDAFDKKALKRYTFGGTSPTYETYRALSDINWEPYNLTEVQLKILNLVDLEKESKYVMEIQKIYQLISKLKAKWTERTVESVYKWYRKANELKGLEALLLFNSNEMFLGVLTEMENVKTINSNRAERFKEAVKNNNNKKYYKKKYKGNKNWKNKNGGNKKSKN